MKTIHLVLMASLVLTRGFAFRFSDHDKHPNATDCMSDGPWGEQERCYPSEELILPAEPVFQVINDTHLEVTIQLDTIGISAYYLAGTGKGHPLLAESQDYFVEKKCDTIKLKAKINPNKDHTLFIVAVSTTNDHKYSKPLVYKATTDTTGFSTTTLALVIAGGVLSFSSVAALAVVVKIYCRRDDG